jgi:hypothetical protein
VVDVGFDSLGAALRVRDAIARRTRADETADDMIAADDLLEWVVEAREELAALRALVGDVGPAKRRPLSEAERAKRARARRRGLEPPDPRHEKRHDASRNASRNVTKNRDENRDAVSPPSPLPKSNPAPISAEPKGKTLILKGVRIARASHETSRDDRDADRDAAPLSFDAELRAQHPSYDSGRVAEEVSRLMQACGLKPWPSDGWAKALCELAQHPRAELGRVFEAALADPWVAKDPSRATPAHLNKMWPKYSAAADKRAGLADEGRDDFDTRAPWEVTGG